MVVTVGLRGKFLSLSRGEVASERGSESQAEMELVLILFGLCI